MRKSNSRGHRLARVITSCSLVTLLIGGIAIVSAPADAAGTFTDDDGSVHETNIEQLARMGVTRGCNPPVNDRYCPDDAVTRGQMAAFLHRALAGILTPTEDTRYADDDDSVFEADIEWLGATGVTRGCNPPDNTRFCPDAFVTRAQMAAFLHRALEGILTPDQPVDFTDDDHSVFEEDIEWLAATGVTLGCNPPDNDRYCPADPVTRAQMASFLVRALSEDGGNGATSSSTSSPETTVDDTTSSTPPTSSTTSTPGSTAPPPPPPEEAAWHEIPPAGVAVDARHENGMAALGTDLYLIGGRGVNSIQRFDTARGLWSNVGTTNDLHHFQPVAHQGKIYIVGALTGQCCEAEEEVPVPNVMVFDPNSGGQPQSYATIPDGRRRGAGAAVLHDGYIYFAGGVTGGHGDEETDNVPFLDRFHIQSKTWEPLENIPHKRDHFQAVVVDNRLYLVGGRRSETTPFNAIFSAAAQVPEVDVYDLDTGEWLTGAHDTPPDLPSPRAAAITTAIGASIYVIGGEGGELSAPDSDAHDRVDRWDTFTRQWVSSIAEIPVPRHGTGAGVCDDDIYVAAGAETRGGGSEVTAFHGLDTEGDDLGCLG